MAQAGVVGVLLPTTICILTSRLENGREWLAVTINIYDDVMSISCIESDA